MIIVHQTIRQLNLEKRTVNCANTSIKNTCFMTAETEFLQVLENKVLVRLRTIVVINVKLLTAI